MSRLPAVAFPQRQNRHNRMIFSFENRPLLAASQCGKNMDGCTFLAEAAKTAVRLVRGVRRRPEVADTLSRMLTAGKAERRERHFWSADRKAS
jgi:hypothetical protein